MQAIVDEIYFTFLSYFSRNAGQLINDIIDSGFEISALGMFNLVDRTASEYLKIATGDIQPHSETISEYVSGPCIALEIKSCDPRNSFNEFCGAVDPVSCEPC